MDKTKWDAPATQQVERKPSDPKLVYDKARRTIVVAKRPASPDDNAAYRRDMIDAGRGHLLR